MKVVITGAGGFLGTELTRRFVAAGHAVRAVDLARADLSAHRELGAETGVCDVTDPAQVDAALEGVEVAVHAAGVFDFTAPEELLWAVNAESLRAVCEAAARHGLGRLVHISSTGVYGRCGLGVDEDRPKRPVMPYERSKWDGERLAWERAEALGLPLTVLRPTLIYGRGSRYGLAPVMALFALRRAAGLPMLPIARGGPVGHLVHVEDVAAAALRLAEADEAVGRAFNVADERPVQAGELIRALARTARVAISDRALPWWLTRLYPPMRPLVRWIVARENRRIAGAWRKLVEREGLVPALNPRLDLDFFDYVLGNHSYDTKALRGLGFRCAHADPIEGLARTAAWYRAQRWLPPVEQA